MKKGLVLLLAVMLVGTALSVEGLAESKSKILTRTPDDRLPLSDLLIARPFGVLAAVAGTGVFIATLPFTLPTKSTDKAAKMLITDPFHFSFTRPFPDEHLMFD